MTIPPSRLIDSLVPGSIVDLFLATQQPDGVLTYEEAGKLARLGLIEGVCTSRGRIRCVRWLSGSAREDKSEERAEQRRAAKEERQRAGSLYVATHMGVFRENLDPGWCWTLEACKDLMFDGEARLVAAKRRAEHEAKMNEMYRGEDAAQAASAA